MKMVKGTYTDEIKCYLCENLLHTHLESEENSDNPSGEVFYCFKKVKDTLWSSPPTETIECSEFDLEH